MKGISGPGNPTLIMKLQTHGSHQVARESPTWIKGGKLCSFDFNDINLFGKKLI
jgi:hypothetical protein